MREGILWDRLRSSWRVMFKGTGIQSAAVDRHHIATVIIAFVLPVALGLAFASSWIYLAVFLAILLLAGVMFVPDIGVGLLILGSFFPSGVSVGDSSVTVMRVIGAVTIVAWIMYASLSGRFSRRLSIHTVLIICYFVFAAISYLWAWDRDFAQRGIISLFWGVGAYMLTLNIVQDDIQLRRLFFIIAAVGLLLSGVGIWQNYQGMEQSYGFSGNANYYAVYCIPILSVVLAVTAVEKNIFLRWLLILIALTMTGALIYSSSRRALFGLGGALIFLALFLKHHRKKTFLAALAMTVFGIALMNVYFRTRLNEMLFIQNIRWDIWKVGMEIYRAHPFFGVGMSNFAVVFDYFLPHIETSRSYYGIGWCAHNTFVTVASELGSVGLLLFVSIQVNVFLQLFRYRKRLLRADSPYILAFTGGLGAGLAGFHVAGFFGEQSLCILPWIFMALVMALGHIIEKSVKQKTQNVGGNVSD